MKRYALAFFLLLLFCIQAVASENDPKFRLDRARKSVELKKYDQALNDYTWFHNNALKYDRSYHGVRLSYAISEWVELGKVYPKAFEKLIKIRDDKILAIKSGNGSRLLFNDVQAINHYANETENTIQLFKHIIHTDPDLAKRCYRIVKDDLIDYGEFKICNQFISNMDKEAFLIKEGLSANLNYHKRNPNDKEFLNWTIDTYVKDVEQIVLILTKNNRFENAKLFLKNASENIEIKRIIENLRRIEKTYLANQSMNAD